jgi:hypothetical protein
LKFLNRVFLFIADSVNKLTILISLDFGGSIMNTGFSEIKPAITYFAPSNLYKVSLNKLFVNSSSCFHPKS